MNKKTHWKKLANPDYIGAYSLMESGKPEDLIVKILSVKREGVTQAGGKSEECTVAQLDNQKPFVINSTNSKTIEKIYNSPFIEDWEGKLITLYCDRTKYKGDMVDCLRVRPTKPVISKPELTIDNPKWNDIIKLIKSGKHKVDYFKEWFDITPKTRALINKIVKA